jgi:hypothetical protein
VKHSKQSKRRSTATQDQLSHTTSQSPTFDCTKKQSPTSHIPLTHTAKVQRGKQNPISKWYFDSR